MILFKGLSNYRCVDEDLQEIPDNNEHGDGNDWTYCRVGNCPSE